jgi:hypothetical protein
MRTILTGRGAGMHDVEGAINESGFTISRLLSPRAAVVDDLAGMWAARRGVPVEVHRADPTAHGPLATWIQNETMVDRADALIAVWDGECHRTQDVLYRARRSGLRVHEHRVIRRAA